MCYQQLNSKVFNCFLPNKQTTCGRPRPLPRPRGSDLDLSLGLGVLASFNITDCYPESTDSRIAKLFQLMYYYSI